MFEFHIDYADPARAARRGRFATPHGTIETPAFMPVGTQATVKGVWPEQLAEIGAQIVLANTYHLLLRPGEEVVARQGGLHRFMGWDGPILSDSGGYQVFSLARPEGALIREGRSQSEKSAGGPWPVAGEPPTRPLTADPRPPTPLLVRIDDRAVVFRSHIDGALVELSPERAVHVQERLGADIIMCLDQCPPHGCPRGELAEAVRRTVLWAKRSRDAWTQGSGVGDERSGKSDEGQPRGPRSTALCPPRSADSRPLPRSPSPRPRVSASPQLPQALFGIVQGGIDVELRRSCAEQLVALDLPGYAIGGLGVGESPAEMYRGLDLTAGHLPADKPRYLMGVGRPQDIVEAVWRGVDLFDCVLPTRNGRNASAFQWTGPPLRLRNARHRDDSLPLDPTCTCPACRRFSRAYVRHLFMAGEMLGPMLVSLHNLAFYQRLMREVRAAIAEGRLEALRREAWRRWERKAGEDMMG